MVTIINEKRINIMTKKKVYVLIGYEYCGEDDYCAVEIYKGDRKKCIEAYNNYFYSSCPMYQK